MSILTALAMVRLGARGRTAEEIDAVIDAVTGLDADELDALVADLRSAVSGAGAGERGGNGDGDGDRAPAVTFADGVWLQRGISLRPDARARLTDAYGAEVRLVDFADDPDAVVHDVNAWVADATRGLVPELLSPGSLQRDGRFVLVDAIHLRAAWSTPFTPSATADAAFTTADGSEVVVPTMRETLTLRLAHGDAWTAAVLPYVGNGLELVLVRPATAGHVTLDALATELDDVLAGLDATASWSQVALRLPRLRITARLRLRDELQRMGMVTAFGPEADFSGLTEDDRVMVDDVVHAATIVVDEHGTEAAAATGVSMRATGMPIDPFELAFDRPFLFALRHTPTGAVLFAGRVDDPRG